MISTADFKKGVRFEWNGEPYMILESTSQSPSARGGATLIKVKVKHILSGQFAAATFKAGEKFREPDIEMRSGEYLYQDGTDWVFLDQVTYEQVALAADTLTDEPYYLTDNLPVRLIYYNQRPVGVELPHSVVLNISQCDPGIRGDTVSAVTKEAIMETGLRVQVPMFIEKTDKLRIDKSSPAI